MKWWRAACPRVRRIAYLVQQRVSIGERLGGGGRLEQGDDSLGHVIHER